MAEDLEEFSKVEKSPAFQFINNFMSELCRYNEYAAFHNLSISDPLRHATILYRSVPDYRLYFLGTTKGEIYTDPKEKEIRLERKIETYFILIQLFPTFWDLPFLRDQLEEYIKQRTQSGNKTTLMLEYSIPLLPRRTQLQLRQFEFAGIKELSIYFTVTRTPTNPMYQLSLSFTIRDMPQTWKHIAEETEAQIKANERTSFSTRKFFDAKK